LVDAILHPVILPIPAARTQIAALAGLGVRTFKFFMSLPGTSQRAGLLEELISLVGKHRGIALIHCEHDGVIAQATASLRREKNDDLHHFAESRPAQAEIRSVEMVLGMGERTQTPLYLVHISTAAALTLCRQAKQRGVRVAVETRPIYLMHGADKYAAEDAGLYTVQPPLRTPADKDALWAAILGDGIDTVASDHVGRSRQTKLLDPDVSRVHSGVPDLELTSPLLFSEGVHKRQLPLARFVALTATNAARLMGLYPKKGTIAVGSDADLALWDPNWSRTVEAATLATRAGFSVYEGETVRGWPRTVIRRGFVCLENGQVLAPPGSGRMLLG
jgi:dihydropyrimidinase